MLSIAFLILLVTLALGYPVCCLAVLTGLRIAHPGQAAAGRIAWSTAGLWLLTSLADFALIHITTSDGPEMPILYVAALIWAAVLLVAGAVYLAVWQRLLGPTTPGRVVLGVLTAAVVFLVIKAVAAATVFATVWKLAAVDYENRAAAYHASQPAASAATFSLAGIPQPDSVTGSAGEGLNQHFTYSEGHPSRGSVLPDSWHLNYPPEYTDLLYCADPPAELEPELIGKLRAAGYTVYRCNVTSGTAMCCAEGPFIAGYKDGVFVQYKIDDLPPALTKNGTNLWFQVWQKYGDAIHDLALEQMRQLK